MVKDCACLCGSGARVHCRARSCADTRIWARIALVSSWFWCPCSLPCALVCGYGVWVRIALVSSWFWCPWAVPCALVCGYGVWARIALVSPWSWCSARLRALVADTSLQAGIALVSPCLLRSCVKDVDMPVVVLDRCLVSTCRKLRSPQLEFVEQVEDNRDRHAQCYCAFVSCMDGVLDS